MICPKCNTNSMHDELVMNSLSRRDNKTYICNRCGQDEAMEDWNNNQPTRILPQFRD